MIAARPEQHARVAASSGSGLRPAACGPGRARLPGRGQRGADVWRRQLGEASDHEHEALEALHGHTP